MKTNLPLIKTIATALFLLTLLGISQKLFAQVKIGANPTVIESTSNLEVEASITGRKVKVNKTSGQVTIADGTQGTGKVLTSDAGGAASWQDLKNTSISSFTQNTGQGITVSLPPGLVCASLACATYANWTGSFSTIKNINDVVIDLTGTYSLAFNTDRVQFLIYLAIDKTTPGVFESAGQFFISESGTGCSGNYYNLKTVLKNLPVRTYNLRAYVVPYFNAGAAGTLAIGTSSNPGTCGSEDTSFQKMVVSVSQ